ncbi:30S ribosomal protein S18 [bacterium]|nr:30S ribosomal protein S18 [bacterium]
MAVRRFAGRKRRQKSKFLGRKKKACRFCVNKVERVDYKDVSILRKFLTDRAKIFPRRTSGNCAKHQRQLAVAIKRARYMALLPCVVE